MKQPSTLRVRLALAGLVAASLAMPLTATADDGRRGDDRRPAQVQQQQPQRAQQDRDRQERERQERERQERERDAQQARQREQAQQAQHAQQERERAERERVAQLERERAERERQALLAQQARAAQQDRREDKRDDRQEDRREDRREDRQDERAEHAATKAAEVAGILVTATPRPTHTPKPTATAGPSATPKPTEQRREDRRDDRREEAGEKVGICHATGSSSNPFVFIVVDKHGATHGHEGHAGDVIGAKSAQDCPQTEVAGATVQGQQSAPANTVPVLAWIVEKFHRIFVIVGFVKPVEVAGEHVAGAQAKAPADHECVATEWHWVINQLDSATQAPAAITVTWANGQTLPVPFVKFDGGVAHYATTANLNSPVVSATAGVLPTTWKGQFNLSHGPCL